MAGVSMFVWIAGDNDLSEYVGGDIGEMKSAIAEGIDIVVQVDDVDAGVKRYRLLPATDLADDLVEQLPESNTGDPEVATAFFTWGWDTYPGDRWVCVLWNHGSGIDERQVAFRFRTLVQRLRSVEAEPSSAEVDTALRAGLHRALFDTTVAAAVDMRAIGMDDTSRDFLDNAELAGVITRVVDHAGRPIDVVGFDACLMSMVEIAYEHRGRIRLILGSEEIEPPEGWRYDAVVRTLAAPELGRKEFQELVDSYVASYAKDPERDLLTLSVIDVAATDELRPRLDVLAEALIASLGTTDGYLLLDRLLKDVQSFRLRDFVDLGDFCRLLVERSADAAVRAAAESTLDVLRSKVVVATACSGNRVARATGIAIYFPHRGDATVAYDRLAFARESQWPRLIAAYRDWQPPAR